MAAAPRPFETARIVEALRGNVRLFAAVGLLSLFGGAVVARMAVPLDYAARAIAHVPNQPAALIAARVLADEVLEGARALAGAQTSAGALRDRVQVQVRGPHQLSITAHAPSETLARSLADAVTSTFVASETERLRSTHTRQAAELEAELARARAARERAEAALTAALAQEGLSELGKELAETRTRVRELETRAADAQSSAMAASARGDVFKQASLARPAKSATGELLDAQRTLSVLLTQRADDDAEVSALRERIRRLSTKVVMPAASAVGNRAEARAQAARARELETQAQAQRDSLSRLVQVAARIAPLSTAREQAQTRAAQLEQRAEAQRAGYAPAEVASRALMVSARGRSLRLLVALLAPLLALLLVTGFVVLNEVRDFRVCTATELAHWLGVPVVTTSAWPERDQALEALIDDLGDAAVDAMGTTLVLPLTELERPLALTLAAQLNARAQRHFRSATGARITIAQPWEGDLGGSRIKRAADVTDRVLWVVAADTYQGKQLAEHRAVIARKAGVAAVLVDAEMRRLTRSVGDVKAFWLSRSDAEAAARSVPPPRVPLH